MEISNAPNLTFKAPSAYVNIMDKPTKAHYRNHYTAMTNYDTALQCAIQPLC